MIMGCPGVRAGAPAGASPRPEAGASAGPRRAQRAALDAGTSAVTVAKAYRLLKAILTTAADDGVIRRNPCRIKGAGQEKSPERPVLTIPQMFALADAIGQRYRCWSCSQFSAVCAGASWPRCAGPISTW